MFARLLVGLLPATGELRLYLNRTGWDFGQCQVNILLVTVGCGGWHVPLYWELPDNRSGSGNAAQRCRARSLRGPAEPQADWPGAGDREFVGHAWLRWLKDDDLFFGVRLPKHHLLTDESGGRRTIADLSLAPEQVRRVAHVQVDGVWGQVWVKALADGEFLFGTAGLSALEQFYATRWTTEQCFQNPKGRRFNLENSYLRCFDKMRQLVALVGLAYAFCLRSFLALLPPFPVPLDAKKTRAKGAGLSEL